MTGAQGTIRRNLGSLVLAVATVLAVAASSAPESTAVTHDLYIRAFCAPGSFCGYASEQEYRDAILLMIHEMNLQWEYLGIAYRPVIFPIVEDNYFSELRGCDSDLEMQDRKIEWRDTYAVPFPDAVTLLLTQERDKCCANPPSPGEPYESLFGIMCNAIDDIKYLGSVFAHEAGHYWCLGHTFTKQDGADTAPNPPEWDGDAASGVFDTSSDPGTFEEWALDPNDNPIPGVDELENGTIIEDHQWCEGVPFPQNVIDTFLDDGSPQKSFCAGICEQRQNGQLVPLVVTPPVSNALSYYSNLCRGPYVVNGYRQESFSPDQKARVAQCITDYPSARDLPDVCATQGGDYDYDGICGFQDGCDAVKNTNQKDADGDGIQDACDPCPTLAGSSADLDGDGLGDPCDNDRDGDGCDNRADQHPDEALFISGSAFSGCGFGTEPTYAFEGDDFDGDGFIDCKDYDDDNDGICDDPEVLDASAPGVPPGGCDGGSDGDACQVGTGISCMFPQGSPTNCPPNWMSCLGSSCFEYFSLLTSVINPAERLVLGDFQTFNRTIYLDKPIGHTISELGQAIQGDFSALGGQVAGGGGFATLAPRQGAGAKPEIGLPEPLAPPAGEALTTRIGDRVRLEIWSKERNEHVATVAEYDVSDLSLGETNRGRFLALTPRYDGDGTLIDMRVESAYARGLYADDPRAADTDGDGRPDLSDTCLLRQDFSQVDSDGDGFGNACDADIDQDLLVTAVDVAAVQGCEGADLLFRIPISEPLDPGDLDGYPSNPPDPSAVDLRIRCAAMDLDADGDVDSGDTAAAMTSLGLPPGPSGRSSHETLCGSCDDGLACTFDECNEATGECRHTPTSCEDGDPCTVNQCDLSTGECLSTSLTCDDGNPCTDDFCDIAAGGCSASPAPFGTPCEDGDLCSTNDVCNGGTCRPGTFAQCDDGEACTLDACDPGTGQCVVLGPTCDDGNPCTLDICQQGSGACMNTPLNGNPCEDGDACTVGETCRIGVCEGGGSLACDDHDLCTVDTCDPAAGCRADPLDCSDGDTCTTDTCDPASGRCGNDPFTVGDPGPMSFTSPVQMSWPLTFGPKHWNTYRGTIPHNGLGSRPPGAQYDHLCFESADFMSDGPVTSFDFADPPAGTAFYYVTTEEIDCTEGTPGADSAGQDRPLPQPCITPP